MPDSPIFVSRAADVEKLHFPAQAIHLLADRADTGGAVSFVRSTLAAGADGARPHTHKTTTELFYMLDGRLDVLAGDEVVSLGKGDLASVPPDTMHAFAAAKGTAADVLIIVTPGIERRFDYFRLLQRVVSGEAQVADVLASQERFDNWFAASPAWDAYQASKAP
jgi:quercetin dioxygenase-like cupin family protein